MPVDDRMRAQTQLILDGHPGAAAHPAADRWGEVDNVRVSLSRVRDPRPRAGRGARRRRARADLRPGGLRRCPGGGGAGDSARAGQQWDCPPDGAEDPDAGPGPCRPPRRGSWARGGKARAPGLRMPGIPAPRLSRVRCRRHHGSRPARRTPALRIPWPETTGTACRVSIVDTGLIPNAAADHPWLAGVRGAEENPYATDSQRRHGDSPVRRPRDVRRRSPALHGPEGIGLRRAGLQHRGRRLRDEPRVQPGGRPRPGPGHPRVHLHLSHSPRSVPAHLRRLLRKAHPPDEGAGRARARRQRRDGHARCGRPPTPG